MLPPEEWGFTHYGNCIDPQEGLSSVEDALEELKSISEYVYDIYTEDDDLKELKLKTFDLKTLSVIDKGESINPAVFMKEKVDGLAYRIGSSEDFYNQHYQDGLKSFVGAYGLLAPVISDAISDSNVSTGDAVKTLLYTYVAYASEFLQEEGIVDDYKEATMIVIKDLLEHFLEIDVDTETFTIDDLFANMMKYLADNMDEPVGVMALSTIINSIPEEYKSQIIPMFGQFHKDYYIDGSTDEINQELTENDVLAEYIKACAYGANPDCSLAGAYDDPKAVRESLYLIIAMGTTNSYPEIAKFIFYDNSADNGHGLLKDAVDILMSELLIDKSESGDVIKEYENISELADEALLNLLNPILKNAVDICDEIYGEEYSEALEYEINGFKNNITEARKAISTLMFYKSGDYDTIGSLEGTLSLVSDAMTVVMSHFDEVYLAYSRMSDRYEEHIIISDEDYHEVLFELNNGRFLKTYDNPVKVLDGDYAVRPSNPIRTGYRFNDWYIDEDLTTKFDFDTPIKEDIILYAKWNRKVSSGKKYSSSNSNKNEVEPHEIVPWSIASEWSLEELKEADKEGLIPETFEKKDFTKQIERLDFCAVAVKLYEAITGKKAEIINDPFTDTNDDYVLKAYSLGITNGISETEFGNGTITREQMATMIARALNKAGIDTTVNLEMVEKFADDDEMHEWGRPSIYYMTEKGIIKGIGENKFNPLGEAKIEEAMAIALRCLMILKF